MIKIINHQYILISHIILFNLIQQLMASQHQDRNSTYQRLQIEGDKKITYQNMSQLVGRITVLCLSTFYYGYCLSYFSTFQQGLNSQVLNLGQTQTVFKSVLIGVIPIGSLIGAAVSPLLMKILTRKQFILVINIMALIVEGIIQITNVYVFLICRIFQGIFIGNYMALVPIYINQLAPNQVVGSFGVFTQFSVVFAIVVSYGIGLIFQAVNLENYDFYRLMVAINGIIILLQTILIMIGYVPESPNSLIAKNKIAQAKQIIGFFTRPQFVEKVYRQKVLQVQIQLGTKTSQQQNIKYPLIAYLLGFELPFMQQITGINAIVTSASTIVKKILPSINNDVPLIINIVQLLATLCTVFILTKIGRRPLALFGNLGLALTDILIGIFFVFDSWQPSGLIIFALLIVFMFIYGISLGPVIWLYVPQIIPAKIVPFATMMNWLASAICVIFTPIVIDANGGNPYPVFFFYGGVTIILFFVNVFYMVETKGKTLGQIMKLFNKEE